MATIKDIVLIHLEDTPVSFARVESILPDHKRDWYQIKLLMLQIPLQTVTWILKDEYINGAEFTMNGKKMRLSLVESPGEEPAEISPQTAPPAPSDESDKPAGATQSPGNIISFADLKNSKTDPEPDIG